MVIRIVWYVMLWPLLWPLLMSSPQSSTSTGAGSGLVLFGSDDSDDDSSSEISSLPTSMSMPSSVPSLHLLYKLSFMPENIFTLSSYRKSDHLNHSFIDTIFNYYLSSVVPHMIFLWNSLQFDPSKCDSFNHFKGAHPHNLG